VNEGVRSSPGAEYKRGYAARSGRHSNTTNGKSKRQVDDGSSELVHSTSRHKHWSRLGWLVNRSHAPLSDPVPTAHASSQASTVPSMPIRRYVRTARYFGSGTATPVTPVRHLWTATGRRSFAVHHIEASSRVRAAVAGHTTRLQTSNPVLCTRGLRLVSFHRRDVGPT
jgi:hypothetical protein